MGVAKTIKRKQEHEYSVLEVFELFQREKIAYGLSTSTIRSYSESLHRFTSALQLDTPSVQDLNKPHILSFIYILQEDGIATASINHYLRDLRSFFNWCYNEKYIQEKIEVKLIKGQETIQETYTDDELQTLLKPPYNDNFRAWRSWAIINWILATGNREKTICNIRMCDLDFVQHEILLQETKNKKAQIIPMSSELSFVLARFIRDFRSDASPKEYLFCNVAGEKLTEHALNQSIRKYNLSRGVSRSSVHALRHTFAKHWVRNNGDVFRLQKMLGHSTLDMTRNYVNMFSSDLKDGFDNINPLNKIAKKNGLKHTIKRNPATTF